MDRRKFITSLAASGFMVSMGNFLFGATKEEPKKELNIKSGQYESDISILPRGLRGGDLCVILGTAGSGKSKVLKEFWLNHSKWCMFMRPGHFDTLNRWEDFIDSLYDGHQGVFIDDFRLPDFADTTQSLTQMKKAAIKHDYPLYITHQLQRGRGDYGIYADDLMGIKLASLVIHTYIKDGRIYGHILKNRYGMKTSFDFGEAKYVGRNELDKFILLKGK